MNHAWNLGRAARVAAAGIFAVLMFAATASAQLFTNPGHPGHPNTPPNPSFGYPFIELTSSIVGPNHPEVPGSATYNGTTLTIKTHPQWVTFENNRSWSGAVSVAQATDENGTSASPCIPVNGQPQFECGSFTINAKIDAQTGLLVGEPTDTDVVFRGHIVLGHFVYWCDNGSPDLSHCSDADGPHDDLLRWMEVVDAELNGTLLTGKVIDYAGQAGDGAGQFQFRIRVTGGLLTNPNAPQWCAAGWSCGAIPELAANWLQPAGFDLGIHITSALPLGSSFATGFTSINAAGTAGSITRMEMSVCYGIIGDRVWNDLNQNGIQDAGEPGIAGAGVTLQHGGDPVKFETTDANGNYLFSRVCNGSNQIDVASPAGYTASPSNAAGGTAETDSNGSGVLVNMSGGAVDRSVDFGYFQVPVVSSAYTTFTQGAWGAKPKGGNAAKILADYFDILYPLGEAVIGLPDTIGRHSITVTGAEAVQTFLPQGGLPWPLDRSYVDPAHINFPKHMGKWKGHFMIGQLAGNVLALKFNIDMSNAGLTRAGLKDLKVKSGTYAGKTVAQIYALANGALAGDPQSSWTIYFALNDVVESINKNFNAGTTNKGFLIP